MPTPAHLSTIDSTLLVVNTRAFTLAIYLKAPDLPYEDQASREAKRLRLRQSMAGYHLIRIAEYAEGESHVTPEAAQESIQFVYKLLFAYPFAEDHTPPASFHRTELGRMISEAYIQLTAGAELLTPTEAYRELHVSRQAIYNFVRDGKLYPLYLYGKMMLFAHEVEDLKLQREGKKTMGSQTYRETSTTTDEFFVDEIEEGVAPVVRQVGGTVRFDEEVQRMDGHIGRYRVVLPSGCTYTGTTGNNPQTMILPGTTRRLCLYPRGSYEMILGFLAGDSADPALWHGIQRLPDEEETTPIG